MRSFFILLFLLGCQRHSSWHFDQIPSKEKACTRLSYRSDDPVRGIDLEFLYDGSELITYLQVHSHPLISEEGKKASVSLISDSEKLYFLADLYVGKQRIRLSDSLQTALIKLLHDGNTVMIQLKGYQQTIEPEDFEKVFQKLKHPPYKIPFHLPI